MKNLIVFTKNFGLNYTGATICTIHLTSELKKSFKQVVVLCFNEGEHGFHNDQKVEIIRLISFFDLFKRIRAIDKDSIFYSDDHFGFLLALLRRRYLHTYHGNWPDAMFVSPIMFLKSFYFIPCYFLTILFAKAVVNVSFNTNALVRKLNRFSFVIRNGIDSEKREDGEVRKNEKRDGSGKLKILMVGNIDSRKYHNALKLFKAEGVGQNRYTVDIYGKNVDSRLAIKLERIDFVDLKGFKRQIPYREYDLLLCLSKSENLPVSICEAIINETPVIAYDVGGICEIVNYENGMVLPKLSLKIWRKTIDDILENRSIFQPSLRVLEDFDWKKARDSYLRLVRLYF